MEVVPPGKENYDILVVIVIAIFGGIIVAELAKAFRQAFLVPEGYAGFVLRVPGFVPLKNGKAGSPAPNTEEGGAS